MVALPAAGVRGRVAYAGDYGGCCFGVPALFARPGKDSCLSTNAKGLCFHPFFRWVLVLVRSRHKGASWRGFISARNRPAKSHHNMIFVSVAAARARAAIQVHGIA